MRLRYEQLRHTFKSPTGDARTVVNIPDWVLNAGQQVLLRGVSGSGKTTLFNISAGLLQPTQGKVFYDETSLFALQPGKRDRFRAQTVGYIFQTHQLLAPLSAIENVVMPMAFARQVPRRQWRDKAADLLSLVGLQDHLDYRPAKLSTGQRLRVAVARALVNNPSVVLADEPTAALDPESGVVVMDLIQKICHENNAILVVASHDPALTQRFETVVNLIEGQITNVSQNIDRTPQHHSENQQVADKVTT